MLGTADTFGTMESKFGVSPEATAQQAAANSAVQTPVHSSTEGNLTPSPTRGIVDPNSAIFWLAVAAVLGLAIVSGELKLSAALKARGGRR